MSATVPIRADERYLIASRNLHGTASHDPDAIDVNSVKRSPIPRLLEIDFAEARVEEYLAVAAADAAVNEEEVGAAAASADRVAAAGTETEEVGRRGGLR